MIESQKGFYLALRGARSDELILSYIKNWTNATDQTLKQCHSRFNCRLAPPDVYSSSFVRFICQLGAVWLVQAWWPLSSSSGWCICIDIHWRPLSAGLCGEKYFTRRYGDDSLSRTTFKYRHLAAEDTTQCQSTGGPCKSGVLQEQKCGVHLPDTPLPRQPLTVKVHIVQSLHKLYPTHYNKQIQAESRGLSCIICSKGMLYYVVGASCINNRSVIVSLVSVFK